MYDRENHQFAAVSDFYDHVDKKRRKKDRIDDNLEISGVLAPLLFVVFWSILGMFIFENDRGINGFNDYALVTFCAALFIGSLFVAFRIVWSSLDVNYARIARKIFTKKILESYSELFLETYKDFNDKAKKAIRKNLKITAEDETFMVLLVNEGYTGSVKDLVSIVKNV